MDVSASTPSATTLHYIKWCNSSPTSSVGLNFSTKLQLQNPAMHMGQFEISELLIWAAHKWAQYSNNEA